MTTEEDLNRLKLEELKVRCRSEELIATGSKADLVARLLAKRKKESSIAENGEAPAEKVAEEAPEAVEPKDANSESKDMQSKENGNKENASPISPVPERKSARVSFADDTKRSELGYRGYGMVRPKMEGHAKRELSDSEVSEQVIDGIGVNDVKESNEGIAMGIRWAASTMQGWRADQEDAYIVVAPLVKEMPKQQRRWATNGNESDDERPASWDKSCLFAVLDGHGGEGVARFMARHFPRELSTLPATNLRQTLTQAFHRMDWRLQQPGGIQELRALGRLPAGEGHVGATAIALVAQGRDIFVANAGNCRAVLCRSDGVAQPLSVDHRPDIPEERERILNAGGWISQDYNSAGGLQHRVNGYLNVSRAIGDLAFKANATLHPSGQIISGTPEVKHVRLEPDDEFVILACDGVWEQKGDQDVVDFIRARLGKVRFFGPGGLQAILEELLDSCLSPDPARTDGKGCDNMTAVLVCFDADDEGVAEITRVLGPDIKKARVKHEEEEEGTQKGQHKRRRRDRESDEERDDGRRKRKRAEEQESEASADERRGRRRRRRSLSEIRKPRRRRRRQVKEEVQSEDDEQGTVPAAPAPDVSWLDQKSKRRRSGEDGEGKPRRRRRRRDANVRRSSSSRSS